MRRLQKACSHLTAVSVGTAYSSFMRVFFSLITRQVQFFIVSKRVHSSFIEGIVVDGELSWSLASCSPFCLLMIAYFLSQPFSMFFLKIVPSVFSQCLSYKSAKMVTVANRPQAIMLNILATSCFLTRKKVSWQKAVTLRVTFSPQLLRQYLILLMAAMGMLPKACEVSLAWQSWSHPSLVFTSTFPSKMTRSGKYMPDRQSLRCSEVMEKREFLEDSRVQWSQPQEGAKWLGEDQLPCISDDYFQASIYAKEQWGGWSGKGMEIVISHWEIYGTNISYKGNQFHLGRTNPMLFQYFDHSIESSLPLPPAPQNTPEQ